MEKEELLNFLALQGKDPENLPYDYLVIPATLSLAEAIEIMNRKDLAFRGVPRLVLIYVSKFSNKAIQEDAALREGFFKAKKHNVILNIDGQDVVDNPHAIALRLLNETLGCTYDTDLVEEMPEDEEEVAFKV